MNTVDVVMGIDLSLTGLGLVAVPVDWDLRWSRVQRISLGIDLSKDASPRDLAMRRRALADDVARWASRRCVSHVWVEEYPSRGKYLFGTSKLAELGGVVKDRLLDLGLSASPVSEVTARKLFLGALPPSDRKRVVFEALKQCGGAFGNTDEADAFTVANYGLSELGIPFLSLGMVRGDSTSETQKRKRAV